ncbi:DUF7657 domain-containing protein [Faecalicatena fissicatena]|uniref:Glycosyltransferase RgtA/B/C/D-like domain-containing protein n=1 Tax=Faecalicatena fissicatena TaxID=290055 RepID=A0ABS2E8M0_9FIRM|nr:hypothetical protein [Faecalicatena fissicatena]MBM6737981.1 hypothetical protein [Faecalicatena fissicatena]
MIDEDVFMFRKKTFSKKWVQIIILLLLSISWALIISTVVTGRLWQIDTLQSNLANLPIWLTLNRAYILFFVLFYLGLHFIFSIRDMYKWIFEKRWILGVLLLVFLTVNRYHGDSIGVYNEWIQPGEGTAASIPIVGETRDIRSDEFLVTTPAVLASTYGDDAYGKYNNILRGTDTLNIINGVYGGYATLGYAPWELVYLILPVENAFSFCWFAPLIFGFLMVMELFCIISKKNKLISVMGAFLVICSSFYLWWGFSPYYVAGPGTIVCLYYFLNSDKSWKKLLYALGTAVCFSIFVTNLYPAWQVPLGYLFLAVGVWMLYENWQKVKKLRGKDWAIVGGCVLFMLSLIASYFLVSQDYIQAISATVYPGERVDNGSFSLYKLMFYSQVPFYAYQEIGNASETGVFFSLFPIPTIMAAYMWIKQKKKDWLIGGLLLVEIPMLIYVTVGLPEIVAKVLLFSNSTAIRTADILGLIQIVLIVAILSRRSECVKMPVFLAVILSMITGGLAIFVSQKYYPEYLNSMQCVLMFVIIVLFCVGLILELKPRTKALLAFGFIAVSIFTGIYIRPVMKGLDAIYTKPVAKEIQEIQKEDENAKWITIGLEPVLSAFSVSCGAPTVNSTNIYPNLKLWESLDAEGEYESIYNRYAHITVELTENETAFETIQADWIRVKISYADLSKTGVNYLMTGGEIELKLDNGYAEFEKTYEQSGIAIYKISYL